MQIESNSRQMPKTKEICSDKKYSDVVYGWFQSESERTSTGIRFVNKKNVNYSQIAKKVNLSRQTVSKRIKNLEEMGLIYENESKNRYELHLLSNVDASLIPKRTLEFLINSQSENGINIYIYLLNRYWANNEKPYIFTLEQIKSFIGISIKTTSNNNCITDVLASLHNNGLICCVLKEEGGGIKTMYSIEWMSFEPLELKKEEEFKKVC